MKNVIRIFLTILLMVSCENSDDSEISNEDQNNASDIANDDMVEESEEEAPFEIAIDDSDLVNLPPDTGGTHMAYPSEPLTTEFGYYMYTPNGYQEDGPKYPLLIFLHGWNDNLGNEPLENVLLSGPPRLIERNEWNPKHPFIVVSPQLTTNYWPPSEMHRFIEYLINTYQVNTSRIYLTGLSLGGGGCWYYVGEIENSYVAAIVPISASGSSHLIKNLSKVPIWAFHGGVDRTVEAYENFGSVPMVEAINATNPKVKARITVYPNVGHNAWTRTYDGTGRNHYNQLYDKYKVDIYDWMLSYKKE